MNINGKQKPGGSLSAIRIVGPGNPEFLPHDKSVWARLFYDGMPYKHLPSEVRWWRSLNLVNLVRGIRKPALAGLLRIMHPYGSLHCTVIRKSGAVLNYGLAGFRLIVDDGVEYIVDAWQNTVELEIMNFHGIGTGSTAPAVGNTALVTELTTQYNPDNTRATGSLTEGATANIFRTVGTNTVDSAVAIQEFGLFNNATSGSGVLFERETFSTINLASGDSLQTTYDVTFTSGG